MSAATSHPLLHHAGAFTPEVIVARGRELRALPSLSENARHRLFAAFVELAQNIARYSAARVGPPGEERGAGEITLGSAPGGEVVVTATNLVAPAAAASLVAQLAALAPLDAAALKILQRERRRGTPPPGSLGAGLGLIELARHATAPPFAITAPGPDGLVRFTLIVRLAAD